MANDSGGLRREFVAGVGTVIAAAVAGCSSIGDTFGDGENSGGEGNGGGTSEPTEAGTPTEEPDAEVGNDPTATDQGTGNGTDGTETSGSDQDNEVSNLQEENESEAEENLEYRQWDADGSISGADAWIEMESPSEQIPEENYDFNEFPNLQVFEEIDVYSDENEAVYLFWVDRGERINLGVGNVTNYENEEGNISDGSQNYTDQSADIERILEEVVEGVDDVSENISEEYVELLM